MTRTIAGLAVLACVLPVDAQLVGSIHRIPDGEELMIRNEGTASIAVFAAAVRRAPDAGTEEGPASAKLGGATSQAPVIFYSDALIGGSRPLAPGEERSLGIFGRVLNGRRMLAEPVVTAGILADGTAIGDTSLRSGLLLRRSNMLWAVETALDVLSVAERQHTPLYELIVQFKRLTDSLHHWYLPQEAQIGLKVYAPLLAALTQLPKAKEGQPDPLASLLAEHLPQLRQQRLTIAEATPSLADGSIRPF